MERVCLNWSGGQAAILTALPRNRCQVTWFGGAPRALELPPHISERLEAREQSRESRGVAGGPGKGEFEPQKPKRKQRKSGSDASQKPTLFRLLPPKEPAELTSVTHELASFCPQYSVHIHLRGGCFDSCMEVQE